MNTKSKQEKPGLRIQSSEIRNLLPLGAQYALRYPYNTVEISSAIQPAPATAFTSYQYFTSHAELPAFAKDFGYKPPGMDFSDRSEGLHERWRKVYTEVKWRKSKQKWRSNIPLQRKASFSLRLKQNPETLKVSGFH
jgi:hypothetical protein